MNKISISRISLLAPLALSIAACGGGGGIGGGTGGDGRGDPPRSPIQNVEMSDIENRTGLQNRQPRNVANAVAMVNNVNGHADARMVLRAKESSADTPSDDAAIFIQVDQNGDGVYDSEADWGSDHVNLNPEGNPISAETGEPYVRTSSHTRGGAEFVMAEHVPDYRSKTTVYVPASEASDMYGGMYVHSRDGGEYFNDAYGAVATWGRETSADNFQAVRNDELATQDGKATYAGVAEAIVSGASNEESGRYRDMNATGEIDFATNSVSTRASMTNIEEGRNGVNMVVSTTATYNTDGTINQGGAQISQLSTGGLSGTSTGELYGPDADTLGVVFAGQNGDQVSVVGGMLLNRTDD